MIMDSTVKIASYNSGGLGLDKRLFLSNILASDEIDFMCIQETWLTHGNIAAVNDIDKNYIGHSVSGIKDGTLLRGRPYGGIAILWRKHLSRNVKPVQTNSKRVCAVTVNTNKGLVLLCCIYMPVDGTNINTEYLEALDNIEVTITKTVPSCVVVIGDFNTDLERDSPHTDAYINFLTRHRLCDAWQLPSASRGCTFYNYSSGGSSVIDRAAISIDYCDFIQKTCILGHGLNSTLGHHPIYIELAISVGKIPLATILPYRERIAWHNVKNEHIYRYKAILDQKLSRITAYPAIFCKNVHCTEMEHYADLSLLCCDIVNCCIDAGYECFPVTKSKAHSKPGWNTEVKELHELSRRAYRCWRDAGSPSSGSVYDEMRQYNKQYHYAARRIKRREAHLRRGKMASAISENKTRDFWQEHKRHTKHRAAAPVISGKSDPNDIVNIFREKYNYLLNSVPSDPDQLNSIKEFIDKNVQLDGCCVAPEEIDDCIDRLNLNKSDGTSSFMSNHLKYGSIGLSKIIADMYSAIMVHGRNPSMFLDTVISSIPKDNSGNLCDQANYRGLAICTAMGKIWDQLILIKYRDKLNTSEHQYGFKSHHSTSACTVTMKEVIRHYIRNGSSVYSCLIDASKAFDRVRVDKLFQLLINRKVPAEVLRVLYDLYARQTIMTRYQSKLSTPFGACNGIRQGGILSPILYTIYADELLLRLKTAGVGCWVGQHYYGAFGYADDITLLCPHPVGLQMMLGICEKYGLEYSVKFNPIKSVCIEYSRRKPLCAPHPIFLAGEKLTWVTEVKHLGAMVQSDLSEVHEAQRVTGDIYGRTNMIAAHYQGDSIDTIRELFNVQCAHLYGAITWNMQDPVLERIDVAWNKCVRRLLGLPYMTHRCLLPHLIGRQRPRMQACDRQKTFVKAAARSQNEHLNYMCLTRNCMNDMLHNPDNDLETKVTAQAIIDLKFCEVDVPFSDNELNDLIYLLCCT